MSLTPHSIVDINTFLRAWIRPHQILWDKLVTVVSGDELQTGQNVATHTLICRILYEFLVFQIDDCQVA